ncbi:hypothetical protein AQPW35_42380 [Rubrivivax pictus]|uniref:Helicase n=1 Tax=Pseudaquabacterium pictum TaxID=2315236 RepID=A0A480AYG0_9BURK|nr:hypothetical protein AQPW35_42380 [Rubrivivax pictus]
MPHAFGVSADLGARLAQLYTEGFGERRDDAFHLPWSDVHAVLRDPALASQRLALLMPPDTAARPRIQSRGAVGDAEFVLQLDGWADAKGKPAQPTPKLVGASLQVGDRFELLPETVWQLLQHLRAFHAVPAAERSRNFKETSFARIRRLATDAGCEVSDYVARTIILTPERLRLAMRRSEAADHNTVELIPGFDEAPVRWLERFDVLPLQDSYDVPDGASLVRVLIDPEVKRVLAEIKAMPGRRVSGPRAEAFVRNPFAVLGEGAAKAVDAEQIETARVAAGIAFERFTPHAEHGPQGEVQRVGLLVQGLGAEDAAAETVWFDVPTALQTFIERLHLRLEQGAQCCFWEGHELEIEGDTAEHLGQLEGWHRAWVQPQLWTAGELFDLDNYSPRVEGIGVERPFIVPVVAKPPGAGGWFEGEAAAGVRVQDPKTGAVTLVPIRFDEIPSLQAAVDAAAAAGDKAVPLPGLARPVPIDDARHALAALAQAGAQIRAKTFAPEKPAVGKQAKQRLVLKRNLEEIDYSEERTDALLPPDGHQMVVPAGLRPEVQLKPYQQEGVAWLQHLWSLSPDQCRGTVLADDMGLGKTLQLLTFMASCFDADPALPPALVVAPVALLENWRNELEKFFLPGTMPMLTLYGDALKPLRVPRHQLDAELKAQGVTRLLVKNWVGGARLVLTTYETMRDLEFTMASQPWSIMVCDEAQKIKTPAALVTRSAKKQKVRFRVACTGTPVENTLADLWCLFDFVQPGMLGALNHFSRTYRQPIEAKTDEQRAKVEELRTVIKPQILHRKKTDVAKDLPQPVEDQDCKQLPMSAFQLGLYRAALNQLREQRDTNPSAQLQTLMAMRQICSDPHGHHHGDTRTIDVTRLVNESPKMGWMINRMKDLAARVDDAHKVIVFCEFRELQLLLQRVIATFFGFAPHIINGDTSADPRALVNRQKLIDDFQRRPGFCAIVLSPLAVGFGVNIQAANHVIHFTRTWNPAKEDQATARAYRIGQTRTVNIYYPSVVSDEVPSFDLKLDALLARKRSLASDMLNGCSDLKVADFADFA